MCEPYWGEDDNGGYTGLDLTSLTPRGLGVAKGVMVSEVNDGVDIDSQDAKSLRYDRPNMQGRDIGEYLSYAELELIAADPDDVNYDNLSEEEKARYNEFGDAWVKKMASGGPQPLAVPVPAILPALPGPVPVSAPQPDELI